MEPAADGNEDNGDDVLSFAKRPCSPPSWEGLEEEAEAGESCDGEALEPDPIPSPGTEIPAAPSRPMAPWFNMDGLWFGGSGGGGAIKLDGEATGDGDPEAGRGGSLGGSLGGPELPVGKGGGLMGVPDPSLWPLLDLAGTGGGWGCWAGVAVGRDDGGGGGGGAMDRFGGGAKDEGSFSCESGVALCEDDRLLESPPLLNTPLCYPS